MDAAELSRWTRFAAKGGIGKCTAKHDCVAEGNEDLMFMRDDVITVLMQIPNMDGVYLGYCEGVVGRFQAQHVHFHSKLKRPVMTKRNSSTSRPSSSSGPQHAKSPTPSMFSASTSTTTSPAPGTPLTPNRPPSHSPSPNTPNTPVTPNTPSFTNDGTGNSSDHGGSRRASVVYAGNTSQSSLKAKPQDVLSPPIVTTSDGDFLSPEPLTASTSTSSTISAVSTSGPLGPVSEPPSPPHSQPTHLPSNSISSVASSASKYSSATSHYSQSQSARSHSPSPSTSSVNTVSTAHTTHTTHTIASVLSGHSAKTLDIDYGFPRTLSPYSISSQGSHSHAHNQSVSSTGSSVHVPQASRPSRKDSIGALRRNPSASTMMSTASSRVRQPSIDSYRSTAQGEADASYLDEDDVDEGDFEMISTPGAGSSFPPIPIPASLQPGHHASSTSSILGPSSLSRPPNTNGNGSFMSASVSRSTSASSISAVKPPPALSRSTSQKSIASVVSTTSDGEVGIGLSLLASLGEGSSDDEDDDSEFGDLEGDTTMKIGPVHEDTDDEGLSYARPTPSASSSSRMESVPLPLEDPTTPHYNSNGFPMSTSATLASTPKPDSINAFNRSSSHSQSPSPSLSTSSASLRSIHSTHSQGANSNVSHGDGSGSNYSHGSDASPSPIPGDAVAAFPQPPVANEMEVRRLSSIMAAQQQQQQQQPQWWSEEGDNEDAMKARAQIAQRNLGSALGGMVPMGSIGAGGRRIGTMSSVSSSSWGSVMAGGKTSGKDKSHAYNPSDASFKSFGSSSSSSSSGGTTTTHPHHQQHTPGSGAENDSGSSPGTPHNPSFSPFASTFPPAMPGASGNSHSTSASLSSSSSSSAAAPTPFPSTESPKSSPTPESFIPAYSRQQNPPMSPSAFSTHSNSNSSNYSNGEDWEGASDIYDNYFYRYSVASKMSGWSGPPGSRLSAATVNSMRSRKQSATSVSAAGLPSMPPGMSRRPSDFGDPSSAAPTPPPPAVTPPPRSVSHSTSNSDSLSSNNLNHLNLRVDPNSALSAINGSSPRTQAEPSPVSPFSTASSSVNSHDHHNSYADEQAQTNVQAIEESQRPLRSRQNSLSSMNLLLGADDTIRHSTSSTSTTGYSQSRRKLIAVNGTGTDSDKGGTSASDYDSDFDDESSLDPRMRNPGRLTIMEAHAAALIAPENAQSVNTTTALKVIKGDGGLVSPRLGGNFTAPLTAAEAQARLAASNTIAISSPTPPNSSTTNNSLSLPSATSSPAKNRPSPLDFANPTRRDDRANQGLHPSPLLHTKWASPVSSAGLSTGTGSVYSDGSGGSAIDMDMNLAGGIASALRQKSSKGKKGRDTAEEQEDDHEDKQGSTNEERSMSLDLDDERFQSMSTAMDKSMTSTTEERVADRHSEHRFVIEDDEELPVHARDGEVDTSMDTMETSDTLSTTGTLRESQGVVKKRVSLGRIMTETPIITTSRSPPPQPLQIGIISGSPASDPSPYSASDLPLDLLPPPSPSSFPPANHIGDENQTSRLRPTLNELRGYTPGQGERQSLFLPHPSAPKPPISGENMGPMFIRGPAPSPSPVQRAGPDPRKLAAHVLQMVLNSPPSPQPQNMLPPPSSVPIRGVNGRTAPPPPPTHLGPTIFARVDVDLASATGPVPITFATQPLGPPPPPLQQAQFSQPPPVINLNNSPGSSPSPSFAGLPTQSQSLQTPPPPSQGRTSPFQGSIPISGRDSPLEMDLDLGNKGARRSATTAGFTSRQPSPQGSSPGKDVPSDQSNTPKPRPRSRSFSAFGLRGSSATTSPTPVPAVPNRENLTSSLRPRGSSTSLTSSTSNSNTPPTTSSSQSPSRPSSLTKQPSNTKLRAATGPSPLSFPQNNSVLMSGIGSIKPPANPLVPTSSPKTSVFPSSLRKVTSASSLRDSRSSISRVIGDVGPSSPPSSPKTSRTSRKQSLQSTISDGHTLESQSPKSPTFPSRSFTRDSDAASTHSAAVSPSPNLALPPSLHTKLSLPNLQRISPSRQGSLSSMSGLPSPRSFEPETVQVKDMDFELIRPTLGFAQPSARSSEDSGLNIPRGPDGRPDPSLFLRADSPAGSVSSGMSGNSRGDLGPRPKPMTRSSDNEASNESHRQREQKWMILIATVPPAQARKSKKVRKLIGDGVPSSVRYLVWSHLTDCKAKNVPGVYTNFVKRAKVPSFQDINRDVKQCFGEHPHLQSTEGPLLSLLQAYLTMVPDVRYSTGLTLIAGQLLLLAPEEDAFWIFVTMMDSVLRPYYSPSSTQLEVDAALFSRALEANDAQVSKKILVDMSMNPAHVCSPWFTSLFVGIIPGDYVNRLWDLFLYEGVPFLIRAGLAIIYCCRRAILEATSENAVLQYLKRPPPTWLPPSPEAFVTLSLSFKVKDDDVRKQRVKMEAQVKRQAQAPPRSTGGAISLPRS